MANRAWIPVRVPGMLPIESNKVQSMRLGGRWIIAVKKIEVLRLEDGFLRRA